MPENLDELMDLPPRLRRKRTSSSVSLTVETIAKKHDCSLLEACTIFLDEDGMNDQEFAAFLTPALRDKLEVEARELNFLKEGDETFELDEWF